MTSPYMSLQMVLTIRPGGKCSSILLYQTKKKGNFIPLFLHSSLSQSRGGIGVFFKVNTWFCYSDTTVDLDDWRQTRLSHLGLSHCFHYPYWCKTFRIFPLTPSSIRGREIVNSIQLFKHSSHEIHPGGNMVSHPISPAPSEANAKVNIVYHYYDTTGDLDDSGKTRLTNLGPSNYSSPSIQAEYLVSSPLSICFLKQPKQMLDFC